MIVNYIYFSLHIMSTYDSIIINNFVIKLRYNNIDIK